MKACERGQAPELLQKYGQAIGEDYAARRRVTPAYRFQWPRREGQSLFEVTRAALADMTDDRCAYCDGHPIDAMGEKQIDHFRPKSREEFYQLACSWQNLFLICYGCNKAKMDQWDEALLRPDDPEFTFSRYFSYRTNTGSLEPNAASTPADQHRAKRTIDLLDLNRAGAATMRKQMVKLILNSSDEELACLGYRFLIPLCRDR